MSCQKKSSVGRKKGVTKSINDLEGMKVEEGYRKKKKKVVLESKRPNRPRFYTVA